MRLGNVLTGLGLGLMRALGLLPLAWLRALGAALGWLLYGLARKRRHVVMCNLRLCFPHLSEAERLRVSCVACTCMAPCMSSKARTPPLFLARIFMVWMRGRPL